MEADVTDHKKLPGCPKAARHGQEIAVTQIRRQGADLELQSQTDLTLSIADIRAFAYHLTE